MLKGVQLIQKEPFFSSSEATVSPHTPSSDDPMSMMRRYNPRTKLATTTL